MPHTILIVEDNELNMKLFNNLLQAYGYNTVACTGGMGCKYQVGCLLSTAREHRPDLILMDIQLPQLSGLELTKMLKADDELKNIPVIACTAFALHGDEEAILDAGCDGFIAKPILVPSFLATIAAHLGLSEPEQG